MSRVQLPATVVQGSHPAFTLVGILRSLTLSDDNGKSMKTDLCVEEYRTLG